MNELIFQIVCSIALLPVNFCCAFWMFREALSLTGMTFQQFLGYSSDTVFPSGRAGVRRRRRFLTRFFQEKSREPEKSIRLLWAFGYCTLPGLAALVFAQYAALSGHPDKLTHALIGNLALALVNFGIACAGRVYRKGHPQDARLAQALKAQRAEEKERGRKSRAKHIVVYSLVGAFFFGILLFFHLGMAKLPGARQAQEIDHETVGAVLAEWGFETADMPAAYWYLDENKLMHVCAGAKGQSKFEFYEYMDGETAGSVYRQIVQDLSQDMDSGERESYETIFSKGGRMFVRSRGGVHSLVMVRDSTIVYAYAPDSLDEINRILFQMGYLKER